MQTKKKILNFKFILGTFFAVSLLGSCAPVTSASDPTTNNSVTTDPTTEPSVSNPTIETPEGSINFDIYTINDFHGATQLSDDYYCEIGLPKMSTVFKQFAKENTSFFLSSGDIFQGTIESNTNRGEYVTRAFNIMGLDATSIGNHEFDWGIEKISVYNDDIIYNDNQYYIDINKIKNIFTNIKFTSTTLIINFI